jgi:ATP/maltotriose-dependent transcriptional regulator MalT
LCTFTDLCAALNDRAAAERLYPVLLPYAEHYALTHLGASTYGPVARSLGVLAAVRGDVPQAEQHYRRALKSAQALRSPTFQAIVLLAHAHTLLDEGRMDRKSFATQLLREALEHSERTHLDGLITYGRQLVRQYAVHALELTPQA